MSSDDDYGDDPYGGDDESGEGGSESGNGESGDEGAEDVSVPASDAGSGIIDVNAPVGNPTQTSSIMPLDTQKHIIISSNFSLGAIRLIVNKHVWKRTGGIAAGWDFVTGFVDVTGDTLASQSTAFVAGGRFKISYNESNCPNRASFRQIRVTWNSGDTKTFQVLLPGRQHYMNWDDQIPSWSGTSGNALKKAYECDYAYPHWSYRTEAYQHYNIQFATATHKKGYYFQDVHDSQNQWPQGFLLGPTVTSPNLSFTSNHARSLGDLQGLTQYNGVVKGSTAAEQHFLGIVANIVFTTNTLPVGGFQPYFGWDTTLTPVAEAYDDAVLALTQNSGGAHGLYDETSSTSQSPTFESIQVYSTHTPTCSAPTVTIDACLDPNSANYYLYTGNDCAGTSISTYCSGCIANPALATWVNCGCPSCDLSINVIGTAPTTHNGTNGVVTITTLFGGASGTANFTFVIVPDNTENAGQGAGTAIGSGATACPTFTFGGPNIQIAQANSCAGGTGTPVYATSSATGYVPAVTSSGTSTQGLEPGGYTAYIFDSNATAACLAQAHFILNNPAEKWGCTDNSAGTFGGDASGGISLNYDSTATVNVQSLCEYCRSTDGKLVSGGTSSVYTLVGTGDILGSNTSTTTTTSNSTAYGEINVSANVASSFQPYINDIVDASNIQNATYNMQLYSLTAAQYVAQNFSAGSTSGLAAVTNATTNGFNYTFNDVNGYNITYGYYAVKFSIGDPDATVEIEQCYQVLYFIIPVLVCEDPAGVYTTSDGVVITDTNLISPSNTICLLLNNYCCDTPSFISSSNGTACAPVFESGLTCSPAAIKAEAELLFYDGATWVTVGSIDIYQNVSSIYTTTYQLSRFQIYGTGTYKVRWTSYYTTSNNCIVESAQHNIRVPIGGCTDSLAINYNPLATCNDGSCIYCVYGCMDGTTPALNYNPAATCDDGTCLYCVYGCMTPQAFNYNPSATCPDGSCSWHNPGCMDPLALNYDPLFDIDDGSCYYCTDPTVVQTIVSATGTCGSPLADGELSITVTLTTPQSTTFTIKYYTNQGTLVSANTIQYSSGATATTVTGLLPGVYQIEITDNQGCIYTENIAITSSSVTLGCTDPTAQNYNSSAICDDGSCIYCGCLDPLACNYNPNAVCDDQSCVYSIEPPPCIPPDIDDLINLSQLCISKKGFDYYRKLIAGKADECSIMNIWKLILIEYLLQKRGLCCLYNCEDAATPDPSSLQTCGDVWVTGGPTTGINDTAQTYTSIATGEGTTITDAINFFVTGTYLNGGDVIKMASGLIWRLKGTGLVNFGGYNPETSLGATSGHWCLCNDLARVTSFCDTTNYLDIFSSFVTKFCTDCDLSNLAPAPLDSIRVNMLGTTKKIIDTTARETLDDISINETEFEINE